jgi:hypothetical protein
MRRLLALRPARYNPHPAVIPIRRRENRMPFVRGTLLLLLQATQPAAVSDAAAPRRYDPAPSASQPADLLTVAETSDFKATARHAEVVALLDRLAAASPLARRAALGQTGEGREIPLLLIGDPPVATPAEAQRQVRDRGKLLVLAIGNIHAGEVDGKEALPILAREILTTPSHPLLQDLILAFAPIYNADGNERVAKTNRPGQLGPDEGMGIRENAAGFDLNRDYIKLEAPETIGLVDFLNRWDPQLFIDTHTTNGCYHRYIITYEGPRTLAGDPRVIEYVRDKLLPTVQADCLRRFNLPTFVYGDFSADHTRWESYPPHARYGTSYVGLRNRLTVLSEGYSYATYRERVLGTRDFVRSVLDYAAAHKDEIRAVLADADRAAREWKPGEKLALRSETIAAPQRVRASGFVEEQRDGRSVSTGVPRDYEVVLMTHQRPALEVERAEAYLIPPGRPRVIEKLRRHGVEVVESAAERELEVEVYRLTKVERAARPFQRHRLVTVEAEPRRERRRIAPGSSVVSGRQRLSALAAYLLEPQSEDGLVTWNEFDEVLEAGEDFPVLRIREPLRLR